jgi:hypothetical protein
VGSAREAAAGCGVDPGWDAVVLGPELLADLLGPRAGAAEVLPLSGYQRELFREAVAGPGGPGLQLEQVYWSWTGPLDPERFRAAWQSVCARESVLRAAFDWAAVSRLVLHPRADADVVHHGPGSGITWEELLERDRLHGFAPHRPPLLRVSLLDGGPGGPVRILLTHHRALLDERSVHLLLREFYRAYLAGGTLPGGERRPDLRDHARWLALRSDDGARELWTRTAPPRHAATAPGRRGGDTRQSGTGRISRRLGAADSARLRAWAATHGAAESSALHLVWALLLYRAAGTAGPLRVSFGVRLSGRDNAVPGAASLPGLLGAQLPLTARVDPAEPLAGLLRQVRDALLDLAAYPWVGGDRIREWSGRGPGERLTESAVSFDGPPGLPPSLRSELAEQGICVDEPRAIATAGPVSLPVTVSARHDGGGALVLDAVHDRARLADADAAAALGQCVRLLRALPELSGPYPTVGRALELLAGVAPPALAPGRPPAGGAGRLRTLRGGAPSAGVICLVGAAGVTPGAYELFARGYDGPETLLTLDAPSGPDGMPRRIRDAPRVILGGCGPGAAAAYHLARHLAEARGIPVPVVMTGVADPVGSATALARGLADA